MSEKKIKGSCLCGAVSFSVTPPLKLFQYCHCSLCRKVSGSAHAANIFVKPEQLTWDSGADYVQRYEVPDVKYYATGFCKRCGSPLPWQTKDGRSVLVPAGSLNEDPGLKPKQNIFWESRAPWHIETGELPKFAEFPVKN